MHSQVATGSGATGSGSRSAATADEAGFNLVEVTTAAFVLMVGLLGVLGMLTRSMSTTAQSNQRVGATNVTRELVEAARGISYDALTPAAMESAIKARGP